MVRETLGDEAVIIATGEERGGKGGVRVTAAIEPAFEIGNDGAAVGSDWLQYDREQDSDTVAEDLTEVMLRHAVPEDITDHIVSCATVMGFDDSGIALIAALEELFTFRPLPLNASNKPIVMIGPPGSGKTLAVAKTAARGVMNGLNVGVISTDTIRAGGVEQLQSFTDLMSIGLKKAQNAQELSRHISDMSGQSDQIIIDTSGLNPFSTDDVRVLARLIGNLDARAVMVLPAGVDAEEAGEMARVFATIGATDILPTRVDIARRLGSTLAAAHQGGLSFSDVSNTPKVAQGLAALTPKTLSRLLMPAAFRDEIFDNLHDKQTKARTQRTGTRQ